MLYYPGQLLKFTVMDKDLLKDDLIGEVIINLSATCPSLVVADKWVPLMPRAEHESESVYTIRNDKGEVTGQLHIALDFKVTVNF